MHTTPGGAVPGGPGAASAGHRATPGDPEAPDAPGGSLAQLGPFVLLAGAAAWLRTHWDSIPPRFPIHWGIEGQPNGWAERGTLAVYGPLLLGALLIVLLAVVGHVQLRAARPIHPGAPAHYTEVRYRRGIFRVMLAAEHLLALTFGWAALLPLLVPASTSANARGGPPPGLAAVLVLPLLFAIGSILYLRRLRPLHAPHPAGPAGPTSAGLHGREDQNRWRGGVFYVNPDDPSLWVPKRLGIGYTLNFARPTAWLVMGLLLAAPLVLLAWLLVHVL